MKPLIIRLIQFVSIVALTASCTAMDIVEDANTLVTVSLRGQSVKSGSIDEDRISDINITVLGEKGAAEEHIFRELDKEPDTPISFTLLEGRPYDIYAFAGAGYDMGALGRNELENLRWHLRYPDSFDHGIPSSCKIEDFVPTKGCTLELELVRMVSRISVKLDRSALDDDVEFYIREARVGNCAKSASVFGRSKALDSSDLFPSGYYTSTTDSFSLYTLENCQGEKNEDLSSYVEMEIDYKSSTHYSKGEKGLIYRFYIRENDSYDVERNCHYNITVRPLGNGLMNEDSWRVDKSSIVEYTGEPYLRIIPSGTSVEGTFYPNYYRIGRGDSLRLKFSCFPAVMKLSLDEEMVEDEENEGRVTYTMDPDGRGLTVKSLGRVCQSSMRILAAKPYETLEELVVIDVGDRAFSRQLPPSISQYSPPGPTEADRRKLYGY